MYLDSKLKKFKENRFFGIFPTNHLWDMAEISIGRPEIGRIILAMSPDIKNLFPNKNAEDNSHSFGR